MAERSYGRPDGADEEEEEELDLVVSLVKVRAWSKLTPFRAIE
jgi:hypothetical protein